MDFNMSTGIMSSFVSTIVSGDFNGSVSNMIGNSGPIAKFVLFILLIFSVISWAVIFLKFKLFWQINRESDKFLAIFRKRSDFSGIYSSIKRLKANPISTIFIACYKNVAIIQNQRVKLGSLSEHDKFLPDNELIESTIKRVTTQEVLKMEKMLPFLATTGSITPFIGLFGTVWGVMDAFRMIGVKGSASIGGVAPGISEALIATAAGLATAIPAVIAYNHFISQLRIINATIEDFIIEFKFLIQQELNKISKVKIDRGADL